mmetsp:Transcript_25985/g.44211  ORF Transcript_25985/g.44211 Transcript_25985/m.44211 type:complete len:286 (+) Transcript_25985:936-1793(+)
MQHGRSDTATTGVRGHLAMTKIMIIGVGEEAKVAGDRVILVATMTRGITIVETRIVINTETAMNVEEATTAIPVMMVEAMGVETVPSERAAASQTTSHQDEMTNQGKVHRRTITAETVATARATTIRRAAKHDTVDEGLSHNIRKKTDHNTSRMKIRMGLTSIPGTDRNQRGDITMTTTLEAKTIDPRIVAMATGMKMHVMVQLQPSRKNRIRCMIAIGFNPPRETVPTGEQAGHKTKREEGHEAEAVTEKPGRAPLVSTGTRGRIRRIKLMLEIKTALMASITN